MNRFPFFGGGGGLGGSTVAIFFLINESIQINDSIKVIKLKVKCNYFYYSSYYFIQLLICLKAEKELPNR